ncbi:MAG: asparaginase domain-containing protein [Rickettsiales bacterium]
MDEKRDILVLTTGGTIEKSASIESDWDPYFNGKTTVNDALDALRAEGRLDASLGTIRVEPICQRISDYITDDDLQNIVDAIKKAPQSRIVITQGTDAMPENTRKLADMLTSQGIEGKIIVVTGAMKPIAVGQESDGFENLIHAVDVALHNAKHGVSIVMHGLVFDPKHVRKDEEGAVFVSSDSNPTHSRGA